MLLFAVIIIIIIILYYYIYYVAYEYICNNTTCYLVASKYDDKQRASMMLEHANKFIINVLRCMKKKYLSTNEDTYDTRMVKYLLKNFNPDNLMENVPSGVNNTSYILNKGQEFALCLREKVSGQDKLHDIHTFEFVILHELSHLSTSSIGHDREFWQNFKKILICAEENGLHQPTDYSKYPVNYCRVEVTYNPFFDHEL